MEINRFCHKTGFAIKGSRNSVSIQNSIKTMQICLNKPIYTTNKGVYLQINF